MGSVARWGRLTATRLHRRCVSAMKARSLGSWAWSLIDGSRSCPTASRISDRTSAYTTYHRTRPKPAHLVELDEATHSGVRVVEGEEEGPAERRDRRLQPRHEKVPQGALQLRIAEGTRVPAARRPLCPLLWTRLTLFPTCLSVSHVSCTLRKASMKSSGSLAGSNATLCRSTSAPRKLWMRVL